MRPPIFSAGFTGPRNKTQEHAVDQNLFDHDRSRTAVSLLNESERSWLWRREDS